MSQHTRAVLYSNRSASYLEDGDKERSLQDAKQALKLAPYYVRTYYRKANVLHKMFQFKKALKGLNCTIFNIFIILKLQTMG